MFIPKRKASAYLKVADINIFLTNFYHKGIWIKRFSQSLPKFSFIIWDSYWYLYLTREQCFININMTSSHFSKLTLPLSIIAEKMLQLAELSTKNLTDHWTGLKCGSRIAGSKVCVLRTYRSARHVLLCIIKLHIFSYCTWRIFLYLGYCSLGLDLDLFAYLRCGVAQRIVLFLIEFFVALSSMLAYEGYFLHYSIFVWFCVFL